MDGQGLALDPPGLPGLGPFHGSVLQRGGKVHVDDDRVFPRFRRSRRVTDPISLQEANAELTLRLRQQELTTEFADFVLQTDAVQPVLDEACMIAARGLECGFAKVLQHMEQEHGFLVVAGTGWRPGVVGHAMLGDDLASPAGYAYKTGQPVLSNHLAREARFRTPQLLIDHGIHRACNVLIRSENRTFGLLEVDSPDVRDFSLSDVSFLQSLAALLASAIDKQVRAESLRQSRGFAQSVLEASPDCVKVLAPDGVVQSINTNGVAMLELGSAADLVGRNWGELWKPEDRPKLAAALADAASGHTVRLDAPAPTALGNQRWWEVVIAPITADAAGHLVAISRDITARVEAAATKDLLMLEVHHRVKNSLQLVQNLLSLQSRAADDPRSADQLLESAARVRTIAAIHDRLYKTGAELTVDVGPYLIGLVEDLRVSLASTLADRQIVIEADDAVWPAADMPTLGLVLTELVTNALKYGAGTISVTFRVAADKRSSLTVADEGGGLPADFDPAKSRGMGMRLLGGMLRGPGAGLQLDRSQPHTCFVAHLPPPRTFSPG